MSIRQEAIWAPSPSTTRGQPVQLSCDPKGTKIAYASGKSIFIRSIDNPAISTQYTDHVCETTVARFSPSGFYIASGDVSGTVRVWDCVGEGKTRGEYHIVSGRINDLAWDGDSQRIIAVGDGKQRFGHCITADSGNTVGEIKGHSKQINSVSIRQMRPMRAAAAGDDRTTVFYHGPPFKYNNGFRSNHTNYIYGVAFSPDGSNLVTVGADRKIWLYDGKTGEPKTEIGSGEHTGSIFSVSWSPDSSKFVTASADQTVKIWDVESGKVTQTWRFGGEGTSISDHQVGVVWPSGRSDGLIISASLSGDLNYLIEGTEDPVRIVTAHQKSINTVHVFQQGEEKSTLWTGSYDGKVNCWDVETGMAEVVQGKGHSTLITGLAHTSDGSGRMYSIGWDDTLRSIDLTSKSYTESETALASQPKGIASINGTVFVASGNEVEIFEDSSKVGSYQSQSSLTAIAAGSKTVAFASEDLKITICSRTESTTLTAETVIETNRDQLTSLAFTPDVSLLAAGDSSGRITVYKTEDGSIVTSRWTAHTARISSLSWDKQGTHLASGSVDSDIYIWNLNKLGDWLEALNAHKDGVHGVAWLSEARIASVGADAAVKIWALDNLD
ncbi:WD40 repeat-like protein [Ascosphaera aggregata]|nr:WD40 repeat-like protein [Ascosphaera aggregata]